MLRLKNVFTCVFLLKKKPKNNNKKQKKKKKKKKKSTYRPMKNSSCFRKQDIFLWRYTHDTSGVTGTEPGDEFYILPLIEINFAVFKPCNTTLCIPNSGLLRLDARHTSRGIMTTNKKYILHFCIYINTRMRPSVFKPLVCESQFDQYLLLV